MGMFDDIKYEAPCPLCNDPITGWQSKDGPQVLAKYTPKELADEVPVDERGRKTFKFYTSCDNCDAWIENWVTQTIADGASVGIEVIDEGN